MALATNKTNNTATVNDHATHHNDLATRVNLLLASVVNAQEPAYGAVGDGTTDDTAALQAALTAAAGKVCFIPSTATFYKITTPLTVPDRTVVVGGWGGSYWERPAGEGTAVIQKTNGDTNGDTVFICGVDCAFRDIQVEGPHPVYYLAVIYPTGTQNPSYGFRSAYTTGSFVDSAGGVEFNNCTARFFSKAGIGGLFDVAQVKFCHLHENLYGIDWGGSDCLVIGSHLNHNVHSGLRITANYNQIIGNRLEWNGRHGITTPNGEHTITGNVIDRNGWSGIFLDVGAWGYAIVGNYFSRNAGGGNGTLGRTNAVTTTATDLDGNIMYLEPGGTATPGSGVDLYKAHISLYYAKYGTICGNRFRAGQDDAGGGAGSPKYVYALRDLDSTQIGVNQDQAGWQGSEGGTAYGDGAGARRYTTGSVSVADMLSFGPQWRYESLQVVGGGVAEFLAPLTINASIAAGSAPNSSLFTDSTTGRLSFKDSGGAVASMESRGLKLPVRVAAPVNVTVASPGATIDGVTMSAGPPKDRVLLANQTTASQNGIYDWVGAAVPMTRATDADTALKLTDSLLVTVDEGTVNKDSVFTLSTNKPITLDTTSLRFTRIHPAAVAVSQPAGIYFAPTAAKLENMPRAQGAFADTGVATLATGTIRVMPLGVLRAGDVLAAVNFLVGTTASAAITNSWGGIARLSDRAVLAVSATSTATTAANTLKTFTFTSAYTADKDELLVAFVMYQATTVPSFLGVNHGNAVVMSTVPVMNGISNTGQTTPIAVAATMTAYTADTEIPYCYAT